MNFEEWFKKLYIEKGFVNSKDELEAAWNAALDEAANVAHSKRLEAARVYGDGGHASAKYCSYIAESIKELKDER
jgi:hypothetical protein